ncbi:MAG: glycosyltransferase family 9 protein [Bacteroidia bacterium]
MYLKRYFRLRHFIKLVRFFLSDSFLFIQKPVVKPKTLLLIKTEAIGDYILFRNFIQVIRESEKFRDYQITLIGNELWKDLALQEDATYCNHFIWINRKKITEDHHYRQQILQEVFQAGFEYVIQANFSREFLIGDSIIRASHAPFRLGSLGDAANDLSVFKSIADSWYTHLFSNNSIPVFEFEKNKVFFEELLQTKLDLKVPFFNKHIEQNPRNGIVLFPGAGELIKQWSTQNFAALLLEIRKTYEGKISICGAPSDAALAEEIINESKDHSVLNLCGKTSLIELSDILAHSELLITNDSGAFHIAAAHQTPCICMMMGRHYGRFAPYPKEANWIELVFPSSFKKYLNEPEQAVELTRYSSPSAINEITVEQVFEAYIKIKINTH